MARNEAKNIARCINSVHRLGKVIIADTGSSDSTKDIAASLGAEVHSIEFDGFGKSKQRACSFADSEYILNLDADEMLTPKLCREIKTGIERESGNSIFALPRLTNFCGHWVFHSGWYPEYVERLFKRDSARFSDDVVHESLIHDGDIKRLSGPLLHYSYPNMKSFLRKMNEYSELGAEKYRKSGGKMAIFKLLINPPVRFMKKLIVDRGFLDGYIGLWIAVLSALGQFQKYWYVLRRI